MSVESKYTLRAQNQSSFPNNNTAYITPERLREFNIDMIDSLVDELGFASYSASVASNSNTFSSSVDSRLDSLELFSTSLDNTYATDAQLTSLSESVALTDATQSNQILALQQFSSSLDATYATDAQLSASASTLQNQITELSASTATVTGNFSQSVATSINGLSQSVVSLNSYTASVSTSVGLLQTFSSSQYKTDSGSFSTRINGIVIGTGFALTGSSNTFKATQFISGNLDITGSLSASLTQGYVWVGGANGRTELAATSSIRGVQFPFTGSASISGSLTVIGNTNSTTLTVDSSISSSTITGIGNVTEYSTSVNSRINSLVSQTSSYAISSSVKSVTDGLTLTSSFTTYTSSTDSRINSIESYTASVSTSVGLLQTFSASQYKSDSSSFDSRLDSEEFKSTTFATTGSNVFKGDQTISGSLTITGSVITTGSVIATQGLVASSSLSVIGTTSYTSASLSGSFVSNIGDIYSSSAAVLNIISLTLAEYNNIVTKSDSTLYVII